MGLLNWFRGAVESATEPVCNSEHGRYASHCDHPKGTADAQIRLHKGCQATVFCNVFQCCRCGVIRYREWDF